MASIGELTATVRADISGYVGPMRQVAATNQQVAASVASTGQPLQFLGQTLTSTTGSAQTLTMAMSRVEHVAVLVGAETAGLGGHFGRLAAQLSALSGVGGVLALAAAGFVAVYEAIKSGSKAAEDQKQTIQDLAHAYDEMSGAVVRNNLALAQAAVAEANRNTHLGITSNYHDFGRFGIRTPGIGQVRDMQAVADANKALLQAQKDLDDWTKEHTAKTQRTMADILRDQANAATLTARTFRDLKDAGFQNLFGVGGSDHAAAVSQLAIERQNLQARADANRHTAETLRLDAADMAILEHNTQLALERVGILENQAQLEKLIATIKGDSSVKDAVKVSATNLREVAQGAAQGFASAFTNALRGQSQSLVASIASVLKDAILGAIDKLISEKIFEALMRAFTPDKTGGASTALSIVGDVIGGSFLAPKVAMAGAMSGGTVVVSGASIPPALSPVQHARDQQWQALLIESNRVAEANGARWRYVRM